MEREERDFSAAGQKYEIKLTEEQKKRIKKLAKELEKQRKRKKLRLPKLLIWAVVVILLLFLVNDYYRKKAEAVAVSGELAVHFIDVGQGDSVFITSGGVNMLIDCGESDAADGVIHYLRERRISRLDYVIATHPHSDHMGGMYKIINEFGIGEVIIPHLDDSSVPTTRFFEKFLDACDKKGCGLTEAVVGRRIAVGEGTAEIIAPIGESYSNLNNYSVGVYLSHGRKSFMLTGDAESSAEAEMLGAGKIRHADVYKAAHHGSSSSSSEKFLAVISPEYAVISCGTGNSYGHPNGAAMNRIAKYTGKIYRTDINGSIIFVSDGTELRVRTER